jgi:hypothetical protein
MPSKKRLEPSVAAIIATIQQHSNIRMNFEERTCCFHQQRHRIASWNKHQEPNRGCRASDLRKFSLTWLG